MAAKKPAPKPARREAQTRVTTFATEEDTAPRGHLLRAGDGLPKPDEQSQSKAQDPFTLLYTQNQVVEPPYRYETIASLYDRSDVLLSCIDAMAVNVGSFGLQFVPFGGAIPPEHKAEADAEWARLQAWIASAPSTSWAELQKRTRVDLETFGDAYWEVLRNARGEIVGLEHLRTYYTRKTPQDRDAIESMRWVRGPDGTWEKQTVWRRFRRYVQWINGTYTYFREFGDTRSVSSSDGMVKENLPASERANEVICFTLYSPDSIYGKPRWRGAAEAVSGRVAAGEINSNSFDNSAIPPLLITVAGALLGDAAAKRVAEYFARSKGRKNRHTPLILEAVSANDVSPTGDLLPASPVRIGVEDLSKVQQNDALFLKYSEAAKADIRQSFRLPPLFVGGAQDYTRATAEASKLVGEEQVFAPERAEQESTLNRTIVPELGVRWWEIRLKGAPLISEDVLLKLIEVGVSSGALTSSEVAALLEPVIGHDLGREEKYSKLPASLVAALIKAGWVPDDVVGLTPPKQPAPPSNGQPPPTAPAQDPPPNDG